jgi:drug/metabolite transporter (DMT)-like permease
MAWLFLTLGAQLLFSLGAHVDKYLLSKYFRGSAPGSLILFSALFSFVVLPLLALRNPAVLSLSGREIGLLLIGGALNICGVILSLYAMQKDEASVVTTLFQLVPVFSYGLAWLVLGEALSAVQIAAALLIMSGAALISLDLTKQRVVLKGAVVVLMTIGSLLLATNAILFKLVAVSNDFWVSTFWSYASLAIVGVALFAFVRPYREQFLHTLRVNRGPVIALNVFNELLAVVGYVMISYAMLLVPVALVSVTSGFQPMMVFLLGVALTKLVPSLPKEALSRKALAQKLVAMAAIVAGTWLLEMP